GLCSLREAVDTNNGTGAGNNGDCTGSGQITLLAGDFVLSLGSLTITANVTIVGAGAGQTTVDAGVACGGSEPTDEPVFVVTNADAAFTGLSITGGNNVSTYGGGIAFSGSGTAHTLTLNAVDVHDNCASHGGGIGANGGSLVVNLNQRTVVENNTA